MEIKLTKFYFCLNLIVRSADFLHKLHFMSVVVVVMLLVSALGFLVIQLFAHIFLLKMQKRDLSINHNHITQTNEFRKLFKEQNKKGKF